MQTASSAEKRDESLYEGVARRVAELIAGGSFKPGDRLYSLRTLSRQMGVSMSTAIEAYGVLEDQGLIEARPQSGYFVRRRSAAPCPRNISSTAAAAPVEVNIAERTHQLLVQAHNPKLVQFGAAIPNPDLLPLSQLASSMIEILRDNPRDDSLYDVPPGCEPLRVQVSRRLGAAGCVVATDDIVTTNGCQEAIYLALRAICKPGDTVALESPTYFGFLQIIQALGLRALEVPTHPVEGIILEALVDAIEEHDVRAVIVQSAFSNPTGSSLSTQKKRELYSLIASREIPLIEDDIYGDLSYNLDRPRLVKEYDTEGLVLLCSSFSKTLAPGYRVGWIAPGRYRKEVAIQKSVLNIATAGAPQAAIASFLARGRYDQHLRRIKRIYARNTSAMAEAIALCFPQGTRVSDPPGGFVLWVEMPESVDALALADWALTAGMTVAPGSIFSAKARYAHSIRLNAAYWSDATRPFLEALGRKACDMALG
ncbi:MAG TPA: PLP-dependent aminotransferase family protein [Capsulimonadaceae bacterium]|jgi:DNA-binding transcriptional MocR family regulator